MGVFFQIFSTAVTFFSIGGRYFNGEPVVHFEKEDRTSQKARNVTIDIQGGRLAKFIRIRLYFASEWLMLSEVYFHAGKYVYYKYLINYEIKLFNYELTLQYFSINYYEVFFIGQNYYITLYFVD